MKSKGLFWALAVIVFGALVAVGIIFFRDEPAILWTLEGIAVIAVVFFIVLYLRLIKPYQIILNGMELMKGQDFSSRLRTVRSGEANRVIEVFNRMMSQLKEERLQVREKNQFLDLLIEASPQGVIILDFDERVSEVNPSGLRLLGIAGISEIKGKKLSESPSPLARSLAGLAAGDNIVLRSSGQSMYRCIRSSFVDRGFDHPFLLVEELTGELMKIEKKSYESIIRMMSHEVNNSVGAIGSTLNVVSDMLHDGQGDGLDEILPAIDASYDRCGNLAKFIANLAEVVKIPLPSLSHVSANELCRSAYALTRIECLRRNIGLSLELSGEDRILMADGIQLEQVLVNIIKNAYESIGSDGEIIIKTLSNPGCITIEDNGPGIPGDVEGKLFTPFFTTKTSGQGIGLMFVREVLTNHGYRYSLESSGGRTRFSILFP